jgi:hypothetical protein
MCYLGALSKVFISSDLCHIEYILIFSYFIAVFYGSGLRKKKSSNNVTHNMAYFSLLLFCDVEFLRENYKCMKGIKKEERGERCIEGSHFR